MFNRALRFAQKAHAGQRRKGADIPYLIHPMEVCTIVATMSTDENLMCAALLHDTVEDTPVTMEEIAEHFNERIVTLVQSETEDKRDGISKSETWKIRKEESLAVLRDTDDLDIKKLWLADKLSNLRASYRMFNEEGEHFWNRFNQKDPKQQEWYYRTIAEYTSELKDYPAWQEYTQYLNYIFKGEYDAID